MSEEEVGYNRAVICSMVQVTVLLLCQINLSPINKQAFGIAVTSQTRESWFSISKYQVLASVIHFSGSGRCQSIMTDYTEKHDRSPRMRPGIIGHLLEA